MLLVRCVNARGAVSCLEQAEAAREEVLRDGERQQRELEDALQRMHEQARKTEKVILPTIHQMFLLFETRDTKES
jgi:hypothetical protein